MGAMLANKPPSRPSPISMGKEPHLATTAITRVGSQKGDVVHLPPIFRRPRLCQNGRGIKITGESHVKHDAAAVAHFIVD